MPRKVRQLTPIDAPERRRLPPLLRRAWYGLNRAFRRRVAHLGLTPQSVHQLGGYRVQGREAEAAQRLRDDAKLLQAAGARLLVLEAVPAALAKTISGELAIPTIGIGAGADTDGQMLVLQDMLGLYPRPSPKFSRNFMQGAESIEAAIRAYVEAVRNKTFPGSEHSFS